MAERDFQRARIGIGHRSGGDAMRRVAERERARAHTATAAIQALGVVAMKSLVACASRCNSAILLCRCASSSSGRVRLAPVAQRRFGAAALSSRAARCATSAKVPYFPCWRWPAA